ncbi:MAG: EAL domain-containing protein [Hoeflea sp.]|nr:EAL domain-containing protein [Hoeflea sp.]
MSLALTSALWLAASAAPITIGLAAGLGRRKTRLALETGRGQAEVERFRKAAYHDSLTGVRNRHALIEDLDEIVARTQGQPAAMTLLLFDLDRFKFINDTMGHSAGDAVLKTLAERLQGHGCAGRGVYRLGGDEFVILWEGSHSEGEISRFCEEFASSVFRPVIHGDAPIDIFGSIGIALAGDEPVLSDLLRRADMALYCAKSKPGTSYCFFTEDMDSDCRRRRRLETAMRAAVASGAFELEYLPVLKAVTLSPSGFKARLRWTHPDLGDVSHTAFLQMAEDNGLIVLIGKWMLRQALSDAGRWDDRAEITLPVSALQLQDPGFAPLVLMALEDARVAPERLVIDIRSNASIGRCPIALTNLEQLRGGGVQIAVSEFAASVAGLSIGRPYPVDRVRLSLASIKAIAGETRMPQVLDLFLQLAAAVDTAVTLTGVDSEDDLQRACAAGAEQLQGGFAGAPLSAERALHYFASMGRLAPIDAYPDILLKAG